MPSLPWARILRSLIAASYAASSAIDRAPFASSHFADA
jgi:hypothetical protein